MFTDFELCISNNGYCSETWNPTRGLFQGNPCAPQIFLYIIEILAIKLKSNPKIEGVEKQSIKALLSLFADDLNLFLKYKQSVWQEVMSTFDQFEMLTGMRN